MQKSQEPYWDLKLHSITRECTITSLTNKTGEDRFTWILQWAEDEHILENSRVTLGSLASVLKFHSEFSTDQQLATTTLSRGKALSYL